MLVRRGGEGLQALQHIVATAFRKQLGDDNRIVIDCNGFRKDKDAELRQMAHFIAEKARSSGIPQEMGPLNPYERRIVHLAIAEDPDGDLREHRRRVHEDRDHLDEKIVRRCWLVVRGGH